MLKVLPERRKNQLGHRVRLLIVAVSRYKDFRLIMDFFNSVYAPSNALLHATSMAGNVFYVCAAVRAKGLIAVYLGYAGLTWLTSYLQVLSMYAEIHSMSRTLIASMRLACTDYRFTVAGRKDQDGVIRRQLMPLKELRVVAGRLFYFDKQLVTNFVYIVLSRSADLLIMH